MLQFLLLWRVVAMCTKILSNRYEKVIVFEDDVRFRPFFHERFRYTMHEVAATGLDWDLMYVLPLCVCCVSSVKCYTVVKNKFVHFAAHKFQITNKWKLDSLLNEPFVNPFVPKTNISQATGFICSTTEVKHLLKFTYLPWNIFHMYLYTCRWTRTSMHCAARQCVSIWSKWKG